MSLKGEIEAKCPNGCPPFTAEIWSYIQGDKEPGLRLALLAREFNLLLCSGCEKPFFPQEAYIYYEPEAEVLAFVFPESYRERADFWRTKMHEDFVVFKKGLGDKLSVDIEPEIFFGVEELAELLEGEDFRGEEREVMEYFAKELGLALYPVSRRFARQNGVPPALPYVPAGAAKPGRTEVLAGLRKVVEANDRLAAYAKYLSELTTSDQADLPPQSSSKDL